jgi:16S rRNA (guanine(966)-N(2))-methyltransferase RsmD
MKVISGKYKGRKILVESKSDYRPTLTRIREDIFNLLLHNNDLNIDLNEVILCDLFAGTGSIGIEALSRGVKKVIFNDIEKNYTNKIEKFLKEINEINYEITNFDPYEQKIDILNKCHVIYIDPPYDHSFELIQKKILMSIQSNILIILESSNLINLDNLILKKQYKNKNLFFFRT